VNGISQWSEADAKQRLGEIVEETVLYRDGTPAKDKSVPPTVICPTDYTALIPDFLEKSVHLVDMGEAFHLNSPPAKGLGTPASYCAPECHFDCAATTQTDIWALACTIFEIRAGYPLFETFLGEYEDEVASQVVTALGKMPEPWWSKWTLRDAFFDEDGKPVQEGMLERVTLEDNLKEIGRDDMEGGSSKEGEGVLTQEEIDDLADLLNKMLRYEPSERINVLTVLQHRWFEREY
jgi:serine/threonine protein kinase